MAKQSLCLACQKAHGKHSENIINCINYINYMFLLPVNSGEFELQCRVADHVASGMRAKYEVMPRPDLLLTTPPTNRTRKYYIQAEPISWNYAPEGYK